MAGVSSVGWAANASRYERERAGRVPGRLKVSPFVCGSCPQPEMNGAGFFLFLGSAG